MLIPILQIFEKKKQLSIYIYLHSSKKNATYILWLNMVKHNYLFFSMSQVYTISAFSTELNIQNLILGLYFSMKFHDTVNYAPMGTNGPGLWYKLKFLQRMVLSAVGIGMGF